jgi:NCAIR mutase (PurE)-related protein
VNRSDLEDLLGEVAEGRLPVTQALERLRDLPFADIGSARIDHHRELRVGVPEVVFAEGKSAGQVAEAAAEILRGSGRCLVTRLSAEKAREAGTRLDGFAYDAESRTAIAGVPAVGLPGNVVIASGGTSDAPVAAEARRTLEFLGVHASLMPDVGVAGLPRLLAARPQLDAAKVVIAIAGMEGALATAIAGLVAAPVIAVPTSVGYGASFGGLAALLAMMSSCAPGVAVVNIDNGFGAAVVARQILAAIDASPPAS